MTSITYVSEDWCAPCKAFWPVVSDVCQKNNVQITKVTAQEASTFHNVQVTSVPTILFYKNGSLVKTSKGATSKSNFESTLRSL